MTEATRPATSRIALGTNQPVSSFQKSRKMLGRLNAYSEEYG